MSNIKTVAIIGFGGRGSNYNLIAKMKDSNLKVVAVVDNKPTKLEYAKKHTGLSDEFLFSNVDDFYAQGKIADYVFVCTQDKEHFAHSMPALELGYDILLEKPISPDLQECLAIEKRAIELGRKIVVCHVLRYSPFYTKIKDIMDSGKIGKIISIEMVENIAYWHFAHSYVRGNWRNSETSSPMIMAKCCHDLDIATWLANSDCTEIVSKGELNFFKREFAPCGATERCMDDCKARKTCPYDVKKRYIRSFKLIPPGFKWFPSWHHLIVGGQPTLKTLTAALETGPYGQCVFMNDNNVVDHQDTIMKFENGISASLTVSAFSNRCYRQIRIRGAYGEIIGDMTKSNITYRVYGALPRKVRVGFMGGIAGHGGGDIKMVRALTTKTDMDTSISRSIMSHKMALAAEHSRLNNGTLVNIEDFCKQSETVELGE